MPKRILLIQGHPDSSEEHLCHALANSYMEGAQSAGHVVRQCNVGALDFPLLRSQKDYESAMLPPLLKPAQDDLLWCDHVVLFFPLWAGDMPALLKGFLEQVLRPEITGTRKGTRVHRPLSGKTARVVVTMAMPALVYRWYFRAHSVKSLERNILGMVGLGPVNETLIGQAAAMPAQDAENWLAKLYRLGARGE